MPPTQPSPAKAIGKPPGSNIVGDPINAGTGNVYRHDEDFHAGPWLTFDRYYNSDPSAGIDTLGQHWRHGYSSHITYVAGAPGAGTATITREDGRVSSYSLASGVWHGEPDVPDALTEQVDTNGNPTGWTVLRVDTRSTEQYDATGHLLSIQNPEGFTTTLSYSTASTPTTVAPAPGFLITITAPSQQIIQLTYNTSGWIKQITAPDGSSYAYNYNGAGDLSTVTYPDGSAITYLYNESGYSGGASTPGLLTGIMDENNVRYMSYSYNAAGQGTNNQMAGGVGSYTMTYNSDGSTDVLDPLGTSRHHTFTTIVGVPNITSVNGICEACETISAWAYDFNGVVNQTTDYKGNITTYQHDGDGMETGVVEGSGSSTPRTIDTDWNDVFHVPTERRWLSYADAIVAKTDWLYNARGQALARCSVDMSVAAAAAYTCATTGTPPAGVRRETYTYCDAVGTGCPLVGLRLTATGPRGGLTQYSYYTNNSASGCGTPGAACYQLGDLYQVTDALGSVTTYASYDGAGRVTRITDANGVNTDMTYTPRGWLQSRSVGGATTSFTYWPYGAIETVTDPDNVTTTFTYDGAHRLTDIKDPQQNDIHYTLDAAGNKTNTQTRNTAGTVVQSLTHSYNTLGQLTAVIDGLNNTVFSANASGSYDANGNLVLSSDAFGIQRQQGFDALNRLTTTIANYNGTDPLTTNTQTTVNHDALNRVTTVTDPSSLITGFTYDGLSNLTKLQSPDTGTSGGATGDTFDAAGNLTLHTDARGVITKYTYDQLNRLTGKIYPAHTGLNVTYTYDQLTPISGCPTNFNIGHLTSMTDASGTTAWCYTNQGDVREVKQVINGVSYLHGYAYTPGRRLLYLQYPSGFELEYGFDTDGRVTTIGYLQQSGPYGSYTNSTLTALITAVSYEPFGPVSGYSWAQGGQSVTRTYDQNYALTDITSAGSPQPLVLHFARDAMGRIGAEGAAPGAVPASESYQYDPLNRLKELDNSTGTLEQKVTYNPTGDRLSQTLAGQSSISYGYNVGTHQLTSVGSALRSPDANGNTTAMTDPNGDLIGLGYDDRNLLTAVTRSGITIGAYQYNGQGVRVWRTITSPSTGQAATVYDPTGTGNLYGEYFATDYREYVYLDGIPVASATDAGRAAPGINYLYADHLGSVRAIVNPQGQGNYQWPWLNNAFGASLTTGSSNFYTRFPGQYFDVETGLEYNGARYYDSSVGRYLQSDPIGLNGGVSTYAYVGGNPLSYIDPLGLMASIICNGNNVAIELDLSFHGEKATPQNISAVVDAIESGWSGPIGGYNVTTTVNVVQFAPSAYNSINLEAGPVQSNAENWSVPSVWGAESYVHEAGHVILGRYYGTGGHDSLPNSIMTADQPLTGREVLQQHITAAMANSANKVTGCGCTK